MKQIPSVADGLLQGTAVGGAAGLAVGSPGWFAWLADDAVRSFSFRSPAGAYTARKERRRRGGAYWVAYRTVAGRQHKVYLGKGEELTPERLAEVTATLAGRISAAAPGSSPGRMDDGADGLLLATKLFVPQSRPDLVPRPRLLDHLDAGLEAGRCSLLSAPAGAGKTTLLAAWLAQLAPDHRCRPARHRQRRATQPPGVPRRRGSAWSAGGVRRPEHGRPEGLGG